MEDFMRFLKITTGRMILIGRLIYIFLSILCGCNKVWDAETNDKVWDAESNDKVWDAETNDTGEPVSTCNICRLIPFR